MIREYTNSIEDAEKLAECFNSFDDSDSWPGSFTGGLKFTAERVMRWHKDHKYLSVYVAEMDNKIVGYCSVDYSQGDPKAYYVSLLGVSPAYQGRGLGKGLLRKAIDSAIKAGAERIDLHTWGGNIKAMPLYKRVGYNWVPDTYVLMENYIPAILNHPILSKFFEKHDWYESLKREIKQEEDRIFENGVYVYKYHFENDDDTLDVWIDRFAKTIMGFEMNLSGDKIKARLVPEHYKAYIGAGQVKVNLELSGFDKEPSILNFEFGEHVVLRDSLPSKLESCSKGLCTASFNISIDETAHQFDTVQIPDGKTESTISAILKIGETQFTLACGVIPVYVFSVNPSNEFSIIQNKRHSKFALVVTNNTDQDLVGKLKFNTVDFTVSPESHSISIKPNKSKLIHIEVSSNKDYLNTTLRCEFEGSVGSKKISLSQDVFLVFMPYSGAYGYKNNDAFTIGNESFKLVVYNRRSYNFMRLIYQDKVDFTIFGLSDDIGPPFAGEASEFSQKKYTIEIDANLSRARLVLSAKSDDYDVVLHRIFEVHAGLLGFKLWHEFEGHVEKLSGLETKTGAWIHTENFTNSVFISKRGLVYFAMPDNESEDAPHDPDDFVESWIANEFPGNKIVTGIMWHKESVSRIGLNFDGISSLRNKIYVDNNHAKTMPFWFVIKKGDWTDIHELYHKLISDTCHYDGKQAKQFINISVDGKSNLADLFAVLPASLQKLVLHTESIRNRESDTSLILNVPTLKLKENKITLEALSTKSIKDANYEIESISHGLHFGSITALTESLNTVFPVFLAVYGDSEIEKQKYVDNDMTVYQINNGLMNFRLSPDYGMTMFSMKIDDDEYLFNRFPEIKPYFYDAFYFGGIRPYVRPLVWFWDKLHYEKASSKWIKEGPWVGVEISTIFEKMPLLSGVSMKLRYLTLPNLPILKMDVGFINDTERPVRFLGGIRMHGTIKGELQNVYHSRLFGRPVWRYSSVGSYISSYDENWAAISDRERKHYIGLVSISDNARVSIVDMGDVGNYFLLSKEILLKQKEQYLISGLSIISEDVRVFRNAWQSLKKVYIEDM